MDYTLLTKREVAGILTIKTHTLDALRRSGSFIPPVRIGGSIRWRSTDVAAWIDANIGGQ